MRCCPPSSTPCPRVRQEFSCWQHHTRFQSTKYQPLHAAAAALSRCRSQGTPLPHCRCTQCNLLLTISSWQQHIQQAPTQTRSRRRQHLGLVGLAAATAASPQCMRRSLSLMSTAPAAAAAQQQQHHEGYEVLASRTAHKPGFRKKTWLLRGIGLCVLLGRCPGSCVREGSVACRIRPPVLCHAVGTAAVSVAAVWHSAPPHFVAWQLTQPVCRHTELHQVSSCVAFMQSN